MLIVSLLTGAFAADYTYKFIHVGEDVPAKEIVFQMAVHLIFWCLVGGLAGGLFVFGK